LRRAGANVVDVDRIDATVIIPIARADRVDPGEGAAPHGTTRIQKFSTYPSEIGRLSRPTAWARKVLAVDATYDGTV